MVQQKEGDLRILKAIKWAVFITATRKITQCSRGTPVVFWK
jgi:hypothetical protein